MGTRILFGGILTGMMISAGEFLLHNLALRGRWVAVVRELVDDPDKAMQSWLLQPGVHTLRALLIGIVCVWLYTRFRAKVRRRTSVWAALLAWGLIYVLPLSLMTGLDIVPLKLALLAAMPALPILLAATAFGAWTCRDTAVPASRSAQVS